ncbi:hypothetical protein PISMIDRAFT_687091 [Pisolithus microcarpus 441]|uniref:Uncharacterized protein n=1 Tax=Pisolithus microcarpus 441 TaxID=765257 RepID=A0A0C9YG84_9AGAM|nr:hypothetical protein PISMIDRAFT_687091 [Pisolithus microcarpus 441]
MPRCAALVHPLTPYLQETLAVDLNLALVLAAMAACARHLPCTSRTHQAAVVGICSRTRAGPTAAVLIPATTITAARHHPHRRSGARTNQPSRETNLSWNGLPAS